MAQRGATDKGKKRGEGEKEGESLIAVSLRECHLPTYLAFQWDRVKEERRSSVPWCGSLAHANRTAASGERLAQVLMELGQTHFTAESHRRGG